MTQTFWSTPTAKTRRFTNQPLSESWSSQRGPQPGPFPGYAFTNFSPSSPIPASTRRPRLWCALSTKWTLGLHRQPSCFWPSRGTTGRRCNRFWQGDELPDLKFITRASQPCDLESLPICFAIFSAVPVWLPNKINNGMPDEEAFSTPLPPPFNGVRFCPASRPAT